MLPRNNTRTRRRTRRSRCIALREIHARLSELDNVRSLVGTRLVHIIELHILPAQVIDVKDDDIWFRRLFSGDWLQGD